MAPMWREGLLYFARALRRTASLRQWKLEAGLARALLNLGKLTDAVEQFRLILADRPGLASLLADYAKVLEQLGQRQAGLREYKQALAADPDLPAARLVLRVWHRTLRRS
jgi:tetratricopeptide (TPR) repeat protein